MKKTNTLPLFLTLAILVFTACSKDEDNKEEEGCTIPNFGETISYTTNNNPNSSDALYIHISGVSGASMDELEFLWSTGETGPEIDNLIPATYSVTINGPNECVAYKDFDLNDQGPSGYAVGDIGPAGGFIFYVNDDGSAYEAAPTNSIMNSVTWGCPGTENSTSTDFGTGQSNTNIILANCPQNGIAAALCDELVINGYDDWFLPSMEELDRLSYAVYQDNPQDYPSGDYWTSSEFYDTVAYTIYLPDGGASYTNKSSAAYVIAVRIAQP